VCVCVCVCVLGRTCRPGRSILIHSNRGDPDAFDRTWADFKKRFGSSSWRGRYYWSGNDNLHNLTAFLGYTELRIMMWPTGWV